MVRRGKEKGGGQRRTKEAGGERIEREGERRKSRRRR